MSKIIDPQSDKQKFYMGSGRSHDRLLESMDKSDAAHERKVQEFINSWENTQAQKQGNTQRQIEWKARKSEQHIVRLKRQQDDKMLRNQIKVMTKKAKRRRNRMEGRIAELDKQFRKEHPIS